MKTVSALDAKNRLGELLDAAQRQPITVTRNGRPSVVVVSAESYDRRRRLSRERMQQAMNRAGVYAAEQGLTKHKLAQLLVDES